MVSILSLPCVALNYILFEQSFNHEAFLFRLAHKHQDF